MVVLHIREYKLGVILFRDLQLTALGLTFTENVQLSTQDPSITQDAYAGLCNCSVSIPTIEVMKYVSEDWYCGTYVAGIKSPAGR